MKKYLLDTNIISYFDRIWTDEYQKVINNLENIWDDDEISISILSLFEYQTSISLAKDDEIRAYLINKKDKLLANFNINNLKINQEIIFWELQKQYLKQTWSNTKAIKKHTVDFMLASQCIDENIIMVSNDNIFKIIAGFRQDFRHENWIDWFYNT